MKNIEQARKNFDDALKIKEKYAAEDRQLASRIRNSENKVISLQKEAEELKSKRPAMLADEEDVSSLNQRLKDIQEEIELNQDTITGVKAKREFNKPDIEYANIKADETFIEFIVANISKLKTEYMNIAPKLAEILVDYITLENIRDGNSYGTTDFDSDTIKSLPNLMDPSKPLFEYNFYQIFSQNNEKVRQKYNIPDYEIH